MQEWVQYIFYGLTSAGALAGATVGVKWFINCRKKHKKHHDTIETYPALFEKHAEEHRKINEKLDWVIDQNIDQLRDKMISYHKRAEAYHKGKTDEDLSLFEKRQFYTIFNKYTAKGGNGDAPRMKAEFDEWYAEELPLIHTYAHYRRN